MTKQWTVRKLPPKEVQKALAHYPALVQTILYRQGVTTAAAAEIYLQPDYYRDLHDPFLLQGMATAVGRIEAAIKAGEKIIIFGDYDADGVPGSAVIGLYFTKIGFTNYEVYIPDRHNEKYGLSSEAVTKLAEQGAKLIITVDCGITDIAEVKVAGELGVDVIITDHHIAPDVLPAAVAIVDPKQAGDTYPYSHLAGCGVAFKLVQALIKSPSIHRGELGATNLPVGWEKWLLDLVAISTVSDMVPMTGENRILTHFGLKVLRRTPRLGLTIFFQTTGLRSQYVLEDDISFTVGPRLNTASRMSHASQAYYLLTTTDVAEATTIAQHLEEKNKERRSRVDEILSRVDEHAEVLSSAPVLVCGDEGWLLGVLGLTATRVVEKYRRPVFLWSKNGQGQIKGSCRSDGTVNMVELMQAAGGNDYFSNFGGHVQAGGFSLLAGRETELAARLATAYGQMTKLTPVTDFVADREVALEDITEDLYRTIESAGPYGVENPKPVLWLKNLIIAKARTFGATGNHLELSFRSNRGELVPAIAFFAKFDSRFTEVGATVDLLATVELSYFKRYPELRLRIVDIRKAE